MRHLQKRVIFDAATYARFRARAVAIANSGSCVNWLAVLGKIRSEGFVHAEEWLTAPNLRAEIDRICGGGKLSAAQVRIRR